VAKGLENPNCTAKNFEMNNRISITTMRSISTLALVRQNFVFLKIEIGKLSFNAFDGNVIHMVQNGRWFTAALGIIDLETHVEMVEPVGFHHMVRSNQSALHDGILK